MGRERRAVGLDLHWSKANSIHLDSLSQHLGQGEPLLPALLGAQILLLRKSDCTPLLVALQSPKSPIYKQDVIFIIILKKIRIATVQRAIQLPAFSLILGHRQNTPAMN